jgi:hypothetical protein
MFIKLFYLNKWMTNPPWKTHDSNDKYKQKLLINPHNKKYYEKSNTSEKYKEWTAVGTMKTYKKN